MSKILVTGASGMVGSHLLFALINAGENVRALKRVTSDLSVVQNVFSADKALLDKIEWMDADILDVNTLDDAFAGITHVYHCAALVSFDARDKNELHKVNAEGTANVVNACLNHSIEKLCYISSVAALGRPDDKAPINLPIDESTQWKKSKQNSNYAISKFAAENEVWRGVAEGLNAVIINPAIILGDGNWKTDSSALFKKVYDGLKFYTEGVNGYVDVRDVVAVMMQLMNSNVSAEKFVLVSESLSYKSVFSLMANAFEKPEPSIKAGKILRSIAWRAYWLSARLTGSYQVISRETARTAAHHYYYSNKKICETLHFTFIPVAETIAFYCNKFRKSAS